MSCDPETDARYEMNFRKGSQGGDGEQLQSTKRGMRKNEQKNRQDSLKSIETNILVDKKLLLH